ncbi:hypothetical protein D3C87_1675690 [compost metagenome]
MGWAASGRNGGFCEASLTHGHENGMARWPKEMPLLDRLGHENLDAIEAAEARYGMDFQFERTGHGASLWFCVYMLRVQGAVLAFFGLV